MLSILFLAGAISASEFLPQVKWHRNQQSLNLKEGEAGAKIAPTGEGKQCQLKDVIESLKIQNGDFGTGDTCGMTFSYACIPKCAEGSYWGVNQQQWDTLKALGPQGVLPESLQDGLALRCKDGKIENRPGASCLEKKEANEVCTFAFQCKSGNCVSGICQPGGGCAVSGLKLPGARLHPTDHVACPFLKDWTTHYELQDWVPEGMECQLTCDRGYTLHTLQHFEKKDVDEKTDSWRCDADGLIYGPRYVACREESCDKLTTHHFPEHNVKITEADVLKDVLSRMVKYNFTSIEGNKAQGLSAYETAVMATKEIDSEVTNDENGLFYVNIPDLQYLTKEREILAVEDTGVRKTVESLMTWINGQGKESIKKAFLSPFCYEGKELGNVEDHPTSCSYVCGEGYVFRTGRSIVMKTTPRNANFIASKPANLMCSEASLSVTPGMCVKIDEVGKKAPLVKALDDEKLAFKWKTFKIEVDEAKQERYGDIVPDGLVSFPENQDEMKIKIEKLLAPDNKDSMKTLGDMRDACQYEKVEFGGEFERQDEIKSVEACRKACIEKPACLVFRYNENQGCAFSTYYYGFQPRTKQLTADQIFTYGWANCEDEERTKRWIPALVQYLTDFNLVGFFEYESINNQGPTAQRRRYTRHVERILDLFDRLIMKFETTGRSFLEFMKRRPKKHELKEIDVRKEATVEGMLSYLEPVYNIESGIGFFSLGSSSDLVKELKRIVNTSFQRNEAVQVNALVAAMKLASTKCKSCDASMKCSRDCACKTSKVFDEGVKKFTKQPEPKAGEALQEGESDANDYCVANADDDADADPSLREQMNYLSCPDTVRAATEEAWDFLFDIPIRSRVMHTVIEKREKERERIDSNHYKPLTLLIEAAELHLETFIIYIFEQDPEVKRLVAESELPGMVGAVVKILALPGKPKYDRVRSMLNLNCITMSNINTGYRDSLWAAWNGKDRKASSDTIDAQEDLEESKTANNAVDCATNFLEEVGALVAADQILAETADILLRQKEAEVSDLKKMLSTKAKGTVEAILLDLTDPSDELIYDGISVINTINSGPSNRIMYAIINHSGYSAGGAFLEQAKRVMRQDQQNLKVNETNRNKRMANMMAIVKQAVATTTSLVGSAVKVAGAAR